LGKGILGNDNKVTKYKNEPFFADGNFHLETL